MNYARTDFTISASPRADQFMIMRTDTCCYYAVSQVAARIWELLETPQSEDDLCTVLQKEFDVDETTCRESVAAFLKELIGSGLVRATLAQ